MSFIGRVLGQQRSGPFRRRKRVVQPQTDEQRGKRACALTARGSIQQSHERTRGWSSARLGRKNWTTTLIPRSSGSGTHPNSAECAGAARCMERRQVQGSAERDEREPGPSKTGTASLPHVKLAPMSAPGPTGERQEHLDAVISFAGAGQRRRLFRVGGVNSAKGARLLGWRRHRE